MGGFPIQSLFGGIPSMGYGPRVDGTRKGEGFLGSLPMRDGSGRVATELSMGTNFDGRERLIPSIVPSLSNIELNYLLSGGKPIRGNPIVESIFKKSVDHARSRIGQGSNPFFQEQDRKVPWIPSLPPTGTPMNFGQNQQRTWGQ